MSIEVKKKIFDATKSFGATKSKKNKKKKGIF